LIFVVFVSYSFFFLQTLYHYCPVDLQTVANGSQKLAMDMQYQNILTPIKNQTGFSSVGLEKTKLGPNGITLTE